MDRGGRQVDGYGSGRRQTVIECIHTAGRFVNRVGPQCDIRVKNIGVIASQANQRVAAWTTGQSVGQAIASERVAQARANDILESGGTATQDQSQSSVNRLHRTDSQVNHYRTRCAGAEVERIATATRLVNRICAER